MDIRPTVILVPGAWSGAWVWDPTASDLRRRGSHAETVTLLGLEPGRSRASIAEVRLEDHVDQLTAHVARAAGPVVLVGHSYSSMVTAQVADRAGDQVAGLIHFGGYMPTDGRSLLDDWGGSESAREQERQAIMEAGNVWLPPQRHMLEYEGDLTDADRNRLAERFTLHPGYTVTDPARLNADTSGQPTTYVVLSPDETSEASRSTDNPPSGWRIEHLMSGHWPMLSRPDEVVDLIAHEVVRYARARR
ncbi:alpha/beta hydrolase [Micromonospora sp. NPDC050686]|uniref:alpha/beta fold hydrolase n=1 Tax=Micromonospora sp. NPDC050686 TaxID=3154631 RepID=UPI00340D9670